MREKITELHKKFHKATIWISGDMNLPDIDWNRNTIVSNNYTHAVNQQALDLVYDIGSEQMINFPTRGNNTLDLFITNRPSLVTRVKPLPGVSDHDIVFIESSTKVSRKKPPERKIFLWKKMDYEDTRTSVLSFAETFIEQNKSENDIEKLWDTFKQQCDLIMNEKVPSKKTSSRPSQLWINRKIKRLSRRKKRAYKRAKISGKDEDIERYKKLQKETKLECKRAYNSYIKDIAVDKNPKKLYSFIGSKKCDSNNITLLKKDGIGYSEPLQKATILNEHFSSVFTEEDTSDMPTMDTNPVPPMKPFSIQEKGVEKLLKNLDPHKAQGPDGIPPHFLKSFAAELAPCLTLIIEASLRQGRIPNDWKKANVTPLFKKGDRTLASNYRPISLTSICCKVMEHIIHSQIMQHLDHYSLLTDQQHGFRKRRSCETQLILTLQDLVSSMEDGDQIDAVLLDFSKAFDKVPHKRHLHKLHHYGIQGNLLQWIESFLTDREQKVLVEGQASEAAPVISGVPQGMSSDRSFFSCTSTTCKAKSPPLPDSSLMTAFCTEESGRLQTLKSYRRT